MQKKERKVEYFEIVWGETDVKQQWAECLCRGSRVYGVNNYSGFIFYKGWEKQKIGILFSKDTDLWRYHPDLNWGVELLQSSALPLGYGTIWSE